jgi:hypothetical protein
MFSTNGSVVYWSKFLYMFHFVNNLENTASMGMVEKLYFILCMTISYFWIQMLYTNNIRNLCELN